MLTTQYRFNANKVDEDSKMELTELQRNSGLKEISAAELSIFHIYIHAHRFKKKTIQLLAKYVASHTPPLVCISRLCEDPYPESFGKRQQVWRGILYRLLPR